MSQFSGPPLQAAAAAAGPLPSPEAVGVVAAATLPYPAEGEGEEEGVEGGLGRRPQLLGAVGAEGAAEEEGWRGAWVVVLPCWCPLLWPLRGPWEEEAAVAAEEGGLGTWRAAYVVRVWCCWRPCHRRGWPRRALC